MAERTSSRIEATGVDPFGSVLQEWANARNVTAVALINAPPKSLNERDVLGLWSQLVGEHRQIDLIIQSPGGDPHCAYQIVELIRRHLRGSDAVLTAVVPFRAASAATLMCLGCDEIMLDDLARLGPLDMQVYEPRKGGAYRYGSALNPGIALQELAESSMVCLSATKGMLTNDGVLPDEAYEIASRFTVGLFSPLFAQVNPERLAEYSRALSVNKEYAVRLLRRHSKLPPAVQENIAEKLVRGYPSHLYYIDYEEAKELKLPVVPVPGTLRMLSLKLLTELITAPSGVHVVAPTARPKRRRAKPTTTKSGKNATRQRKAPAPPTAASRAALTTGNGKR